MTRSCKGLHYVVMDLCCIKPGYTVPDCDVKVRTAPSVTRTMQSGTPFRTVWDGLWCAASWCAVLCRVVLRPVLL